MNDYLADREAAKRRPMERTRSSVAKHITGSPLGNMQVSKLRQSHLETWWEALSTAKRRKPGWTRLRMPGSAKQPPTAFGPSSGRH